MISSYVLVFPIGDWTTTHCLGPSLPLCPKFIISPSCIDFVFYYLIVLLTYLSLWRFAFGFVWIVLFWKLGTYLTIISVALFLNSQPRLSVIMFYNVKIFTNLLYLIRNNSCSWIVVLLGILWFVEAAHLSFVLDRSVQVLFLFLWDEVKVLLLAMYCFTHLDPFIHHILFTWVCVGRRSNRLAIALGVSFGFVVLITVALGSFCWYRKKQTRLLILNLNR